MITPDIDALYRKLGGPGRYHILIYILLSGNVYPIVLNHLVMAIFGAKTKHHCTVPDNIPLNVSVPMVIHDGKVVPDSCLVYRDFNKSTGETIPCPNGWTYIVGPHESNIITEWDLVCEYSYLSNLATTIYFCGVMFGGLLFGQLSDHWGRKPSMLVTLYGNLVIGTILAFVPSYWMFVVFRFIQGVLLQGLQTVSYVMIMEFFTPEHRTEAGTIFEVVWGTGVIWLAFVSWLIQDWRYIQLALTLPSLLSIVYIWFIPESIRWLITKQKYKEAEAVVRKIAKFNQVSISEDPFQIKPLQGQSNGNVTDPKKYTVLDMIRTPKLRLRTIILFYIWLSVAVGYYGLSLSITSLAGNKYLNLFIGGLCELPAYCAAIFVIKRFGRRYPMLISLIIGGVFCITAGAIPSKTPNGVNLRLLSTALAVIGRFGLAGCFCLILLFSSELYPTVIRNVSLGACAFWARVGGVLAPQILQLGKYTFDAFPIVMFGSMAILGSGLSLLLPETLNKRLPDTVEEAEFIHEVVVAKVPPGVCNNSNPSQGDPMEQEADQVDSLLKEEDTDKNETNL